MKTHALTAFVILTAFSLPARAATFVVDRTDDTASATACTAAANDCSLRGAVIAANAASGADIITLPAGTYSLTVTGLDEDAAATGDLDVTGDLTLNGAGAKTTIIDGNATDRVLHVDPLFAGAGNVVVLLNDLTLQNGHPTGATKDGGGILNQGKLTLTRCAVKNNTTGTNGDGGGIYDDGGPEVTCIDSTFSGNSARNGGAVSNSNTATFTNCTISGNVASDQGGGLFSTDSLTLLNSTVANNTATTTQGGGIYNADITGGQTFVKNTIVAGNTGGNCAGTITSQGNNLDSAATCGLSGTDDITATDPLLGPLSDNGGPTPTHALLEGSPAIDAGTSSGAPTADQRGFARTAAVDMGSFEVVCGDGLLQTFAGESCDDGNTAVGDGCSDVCAVESGFTCTGSPSDCVPEGGTTGGSTSGSSGSGGCSLVR